MTRPVCLVDGSDNRTLIPAYGMRQCVFKDTGLAGGNINVDFTTADNTDPDQDGNITFMEPNQAYIATICRLAEVALSQVIVCNMNFTNALGSNFQTNVVKLMVADNMVYLKFRLNSNQNAIRFRFLGMAVTDNIRVCVAKIS